ncbi:MAG: Uma2 family endonuclease [Ignavibacteria bacterium]|nr:Uma2 family endonuclease [Ignavibacteria bacterium]
MTTKDKNYISPEEYLKIERASEIKHEYFNGEMFAMSGASLKHNIITSNLLIDLGNKLKIQIVFHSEAICVYMFPKMDYILILTCQFFAGK